MRFITKIRAEFQSRSLFVISVIQHLSDMYIFHVENDRRFPFSLVLSISHLDHFRGISSRRSPSISPLLVNEKVVDHFFEINDKKKKKGEGEKEKRRIDKWSENSLARFISKPVSLLSAPVFRVGAQFDASISAGKKILEDLSSLQYFKYGVQYLEVEGKKKKNDAQWYN